LNGIEYDEYGYINKRLDNINKNGKIKEYNRNFILTFEGEYSNRKRNGKGKKYYNDGKLDFEGEFWNGKNMDWENIMIIMVI